MTNTIHLGYQSLNLDVSSPEAYSNAIRPSSPFVGKKASQFKAIPPMGLSFWKPAHFPASGFAVILSLCFFISVLSCHAQTRRIDSLNRLLKTHMSDSTRMKAMIELSDFQSNINVDSAYTVALALEELALKQADRRWLGRAYMCKGFVFYRQSLAELALDYFHKANLIFQSTSDLAGISDACNRIALIYKNQNRYKESLELLSRSLAIRKKLGNRQAVSTALNNIGTVYEHMGKYREALKYYLDSYHLDSLIHDPDGLSMSSFNQGYIHDRLGDHSGARSMYLKSLKISKAFNDKWEIADTWFFMAQSYLESGDTQSALRYLDSSAALAQQTNSRELLKKIHLAQSNFYSRRKDYDRANHYLKEYVKDFENNYNTKISRSITDMQRSDELKNREKSFIKNRLIQEEKLQSQEKLLRNQRLFLAAGTIILLMAIALIFLLFKSQRDKQASLAKLKNLNYRVKLLNENLEYKVEERTRELTETREQIYQFRLDQILKEEKLKTEFNKQMAQSEMKALRAQMNPHFLFNCLNSINRYIIRNDQTRASAYLSKFARLMRLILNNSKKSLIWLEDEIDSVRLYMELEQLRYENKFSFEIQVQPDLSISDLLVPPMIMQPFIENAIWHGFMHSEKKGLLQVKISLDQNTIKVVIEDNGIGRKKALEIKNAADFGQESYGLKISEERLGLLSQDKDIAGRLAIEDLEEDGLPSGTRVTISMPATLSPD